MVIFLDAARPLLKKTSLKSTGGGSKSTEMLKHHKIYQTFKS